MKYCLCGCDNPVFSHGYSRNCQYKRTDEKAMKSKNKPNNKPPLKKQYKKRGVGELFDRILATREPVSWLTGKPIECTYNNCAHVVPVGNSEYKKLCELDADNILLLTAFEHHLIDQGSQEQRDKYTREVVSQGGQCDWGKWYNYKSLMIEKYELLKKSL